MPPPVTKPAIRGGKNIITQGVKYMKKIAPKISDTAAEFYPSLFASLNGGATYALEAFPKLYQRTLHGMKGRFSKSELSLMLDVMNATMLTPQSAGYHLAANVADGIALDGLDEKWEIDGKTLNEKLAALPPFEAACLEIWANGFWYAKDRKDIQSGEDFENWLAQLI